MVRWIQRRHCIRCPPPREPPQQPELGEPGWQQTVSKAQTQAAQSAGERLKFVQVPSRQNWLTGPARRSLNTQRQVFSGTPAQESPFSPLPSWP
jgi:hypothetical protein